MFKRCLLLVLALAGSTPILMADCASSSCSTSSSCCTTSCRSSCDDCGCPCSGKTYMAIRPLYQSVRPELISGFRNDRMLAAEDGWGGAFDFVVFGGKSTKRRDVGSYFTPFCKNCLTFVEARGDTGDVLAQNFNIFTVNQNFQSTVCFEGQRSEIGLGLHYKQAFCIKDDNRFWYLDINAPLTWVRHQFDLCETVSNNGGGVVASANNSTAVANVTEAFKQESWKFGRIDNCDQKKFGLADIEFKVGYQWFWKECCHIASYFGVLIPTGNKPKACQVFEPIVGHGGHWGVMMGSEGGYEIWRSCNEKWDLHLDYNIHAQYLFNAKQRRSFDLKNKPWSRYQEVYLDKAQAEQAAALCPQASNLACVSLATPGINVFTPCVKVKPGYQFNMTTALTLSNVCGFQGELGYNFYARQRECIDLCWQEGPALKHAEGAGQTTVVRNITPNRCLNDLCAISLANFDTAVITKNDIDTDSAQTPAGLSYLVYAALGYRWDDRCIPFDVNFGGSYEFSQRDFAMLNRWTLWGKFGISF